MRTEARSERPAERTKRTIQALRQQGRSEAEITAYVEALELAEYQGARHR